MKAPHIAKGSMKSGMKGMKGGRSSKSYRPMK